MLFPSRFVGFLPLAYDPPLVGIATQIILLFAYLQLWDGKSYIYAVFMSFGLTLIWLWMVNKLVMVSRLSLFVQLAGFVIAVQNVWLGVTLIIIGGVLTRYNFTKRFDRHHLYMRKSYKSKFGYLIPTKYPLSLQECLYTIMAIEDINRPRLFRLMERIYKNIYRRKEYVSTGIMQIQSRTALSDTESIVIALRTLRILNALAKRHGYIRKENRMGYIMDEYNGGGDYYKIYRQSLMELHGQTLQTSKK